MIPSSKMKSKTRVNISKSTLWAIYQDYNSNKVNIKNFKRLAYVLCQTSKLTM